MPRERKRRALPSPAVRAETVETAPSPFASWFCGRKHMLVLDLESGRVTRAAVKARYRCRDTDIDALVTVYGERARTVRERAA